MASSQQPQLLVAQSSVPPSAPPPPPQSMLISTSVPRPRYKMHPTTDAPQYTAAAHNTIHSNSNIPTSSPQVRAPAPPATTTPQPPPSSHNSAPSATTSPTVVTACTSAPPPPPPPPPPTHFASLDTVTDSFIRQAKTRNPDLEIKQVHESASTRYRLTKKRKQHDLSFQVAEAQRTGDPTFVKSVKKRVDNHASAVASRERQEFLVQSFERRLRDEMATVTQMAEALLQYKAQCERMERKMQAQEHIWSMARTDTFAFAFAAAAAAAAATNVPATNVNSPEPAESADGCSNRQQQQQQQNTRQPQSQPQQQRNHSQQQKHHHHHRHGQQQQQHDNALQQVDQLTQNTAVSQSTVIQQGNLKELALEALHAPVANEATALAGSTEESEAWIPGTDSFGLESTVTGETDDDTWKEARIYATVFDDAVPSVQLLDQRTKLDEDETQRLHPEIVQSAFDEMRRKQEEEESHNPVA